MIDVAAVFCYYLQFFSDGHQKKTSNLADGIQITGDYTDEVKRTHW